MGLSMCGYRAERAGEGTEASPTVATAGRGGNECVGETRRMERECGVVLERVVWCGCVRGAVGRGGGKVVV
jgi:hypothetical protein